MSTIDLQPADLATLRGGLTRRLVVFRSRVRRRVALEGVVLVVAVVVGLSLLSLLLDYELHLSLPMRLVYLAVLFFLAAIAAWRFIIQPLRNTLSLINLAVAVDKKRGPGLALAPRIATVLQLPDLLRDDRSASPLMIADAVRRSHESLRDIDFDQHLDPRRRSLHAGAMVALLVAPLIWAALQPSVAGLWARRWFLGSHEHWPQRNHLVVAGMTDGKIVVPRGEAYSLRVVAAPGSVSPEKVSLRLTESGSNPVSGSMVRFAAGDFRYDMPAVRETMTVKIWGGDESLDPFTVEPIDRPRITKLELVSQHPTQQKPETHTFSGGDTDLAFMPKTKMAMTLTSNVPLAGVRVHDAAKQPLVFRRVDEKRYIAEWTLEHAVQVQVELVASAAGLTSLPTPISIGIKGDQPPRVTVQSSGVRQRVTAQAKIPLSIQAIDDNGLASVGLMIQSIGADAVDAPATQPATQPAGPPEQRVSLYGPTKPAVEVEFQQPYTVELAPMKLSVGTIVALHGAAMDDCFTGPQAGVSCTLTFRVVTPEELFRDILIRQQQDRAKFRKLLEDAEKLRQNLETAGTTEAALPASRLHRAIQRDVSRVGVSITESMTEMKLNALGGPEAFDLMEKNVLGPLKKLDQELMTPQRDALDALAQGGGKAEAFAEASARQEKIVETMRGILKQMSQWDSFVDVLNQLDEIIKLQTQVQEGTEKLKEKDTEGLFKP